MATGKVKKKVKVKVKVRVADGRRTVVERLPEAPAETPDLTLVSPPAPGGAGAEPGVLTALEELPGGEPEARRQKMARRQPTPAPVEISREIIGTKVLEQDGRKTIRRKIKVKVRLAPVEPEAGAEATLLSPARPEAAAAPAPGRADLPDYAGRFRPLDEITLAPLMAEVQAAGFQLAHLASRSYEHEPAQIEAVLRGPVRLAARELLSCLLGVIGDFKRGWREVLPREHLLSFRSGVGLFAEAVGLLAEYAANELALRQGRIGPRGTADLLLRLEETAAAGLQPLAGQLARCAALEQLLDPAQGRQAAKRLLVRPELPAPLREAAAADPEGALLPLVSARRLLHELGELVPSLLETFRAGWRPRPGPATPEAPPELCLPAGKAFYLGGLIPGADLSLSAVQVAADTYDLEALSRHLSGLDRAEPAERAGRLLTAIFGGGSGELWLPGYLQLLQAGGYALAPSVRGWLRGRLGSVLQILKLTLERLPRAGEKRRAALLAEAERESDRRARAAAAEPFLRRVAADLVRVLRWGPPAEFGERPDWTQRLGELLRLLTAADEGDREGLRRALDAQDRQLSQLEQQLRENGARLDRQGASLDELRRRLDSAPPPGPKHPQAALRRRELARQVAEAEQKLAALRGEGESLRRRREKLAEARAKGAGEYERLQQAHLKEWYRLQEALAPLRRRLAHREDRQQWLADFFQRYAGGEYLRHQLAVFLAAHLGEDLLAAAAAQIAAGGLPGEPPAAPGAEPLPQLAGMRRLVDRCRQRFRHDLQAIPEELRQKAFRRLFRQEDLASLKGLATDQRLVIRFANLLRYLRERLEHIRRECPLPLRDAARRIELVKSERPGINALAFRSGTEYEYAFLDAGRGVLYLAGGLVDRIWALHGESRWYAVLTRLVRYTILRDLARASPACGAAGRESELVERLENLRALPERDLELRRHLYRCLELHRADLPRLLHELAGAVVDSLEQAGDLEARTQGQEEEELTAWARQESQGFSETIQTQNAILAENLARLERNLAGRVRLATNSGEGIRLDEEWIRKQLALGQRGRRGAERGRKREEAAPRQTLDAASLRRLTDEVYKEAVGQSLAAYKARFHALLEEFRQRRRLLPPAPEEREAGLARLQAAHEERLAALQDEFFPELKRERELAKRDAAEYRRRQEDNEAQLREHRLKVEREKTARLARLRAERVPAREGLDRAVQEVKMEDARRHREDALAFRARVQEQLEQAASGWPKPGDVEIAYQFAPDEIAAPEDEGQDVSAGIPAPGQEGDAEEK